MLTLVHAADIHLETVFTESRGGSRRRAALADAFARIVDLALARNADALTFGGDVYESRRAGPQTARLIDDQLARFGRPVFIAPGNHDPFSAQAIYARDARPPNVRIFNEPAWAAFPLTDDVTLYGFGHTPAEPGRPFARAVFDRPGVRLALVHGSDEDRCPPGKRATAPFTAAEIRAAGTTLALCGHYHGGYVRHDERGPVLAYPGSPEPIRFGERGHHGALVVSVESGRVAVEAVDLARTRLLEIDVSLAGAGSEHAVIAALEVALADAGSDDYVRLRLTGEVAPGSRIDTAFLAAHCGGQLGSLDITDATFAADYETIAREGTVRGQVVRDLLARSRAGDSDAGRALAYAVAAFAGETIVP